MNGIGNVTAQLLESLDILTCGDIFEKRGLLYYCFSQRSFAFFLKVLGPSLVNVFVLPRYWRRDSFSKKRKEVPRKATHIQEYRQQAYSAQQTERDCPTGFWRYERQEFAGKSPGCPSND
jgi:hypothetical protein